MNRKSVFWVATLSIFFVVLIALFVYSHWGRTLIYYDETRALSGIGKKYLDKPDLFKVVKNDKSEEEIFVDSVDIHSYDSNAYTKTFIPAHTALIYSVGFFQGWETIQDSNDLYLILNQGENGIEKYRVVVDFKNREKTTLTSFRIENTGFLNFDNSKLVKVISQSSYGWGINRLKGSLKKGDAVAVYPVYNDKGSVTTDIDGNVILGAVLLRRVFGFSELYIQMFFLR